MCSGPIAMARRMILTMAGLDHTTRRRLRLYIPRMRREALALLHAGQHHAPAAAGEASTVQQSHAHDVQGSVDTHAMVAADLDTAVNAWNAATTAYETPMINDSSQLTESAQLIELLKSVQNVLLAAKPGPVISSSSEDQWDEATVWDVYCTFLDRPLGKTDEEIDSDSIEALASSDREAAAELAIR